jgi:hypothetical protein
MLEGLDRRHSFGWIYYEQVFYEVACFCRQLIIPHFPIKVIVQAIDVEFKAFFVNPVEGMASTQQLKADDTDGPHIAHDIVALSALEYLWCHV